MHTTIREKMALYQPTFGTDEITSPEHAAAIVVPMFDGMDREACVVVTVDTKHFLIATHLVSVGSLGNTFMSPREILRECLLDNAAAFMVAHNHPSGDPEPSKDDEAVTRRLDRAADVIGIELLDHLVVGGYGWVSLARRNVI